MAEAAAGTEMVGKDGARRDSDSSKVDPAERKNEPKYNRFTQQELPACRPLLTPKLVIGVFFLLGLVFIPLGALILTASKNVSEQTYRYDNDPDCDGKGKDNTEREKNVVELTNGEGKSCSVEIEITADMKKPIYFYYELHNYYQNHRRYVKSRSDAQLRGDDTNATSMLSSLGMGAGSLDDCEPQKDLVVGGETRGTINPCGLIAWSYFNDTYKFERKGAAETNFTVQNISEKGIAWKSDIKGKYAKHRVENFNDDPGQRGGGTIEDTMLDEDEHFIVWMRTATLPTFRKLWGRFDEDFKKGDTLKVNITNRYNTYRFDGQKKLVITTTSWLGGKNDFLGIAYVVVGAVCMGLGLVFFVLHIKNPRQSGDPSLLSWNKPK